MRFLHPGDAGDEARERGAFLARVEATLVEVKRASKERSLAAATDATLASVRALHPSLDAEVLADHGAGRVVVITPRDARKLRPLAGLLAERAAGVEGVRFTSHRPARGFEEMLETVGREHGFDLSAARARAGFARGHLLELVIYADGFGARGDEQAAVAAERAAEVLLGERVLDDWVGQIDCEPLPRRGPLRVVQREAAPTFPLAELPQTLASAIEALSAELPDMARLSMPREGWVLFEAEPEAAAEYAEQDDVALASSALPEMLKCFLEGAPFSSKRFVRGGASLAYLKLDAHGASFEERVAARVRLEDEVAAALSARRLGAVVGNGLGLRYAYVDVALAPGPEPLRVLCEVARASGVSRRSWVQFCDTDLGAEWVGVWPDAPTPPGFG